MAKKVVEVKQGMNMWRPTVKADEIEGNVTEIKAGEFGNQYCVDDSRAGKIWTPSHKMLQSRLANVKKGVYVKIVFEGTELPKVKGQNPMAVYKVFVEDV